MAKKKTVISEVASALGATVARVESAKPKRGTTTKHAKAKLPQAATEPVSATELVQEIPLQDEIALNAYLYWEQRGFQGGSPAEDWARAEQEVRQRRLLRNQTA